MQVSMNAPFNLLNTGGRRANMLSRDHSLASIPVSPPQKKCDDTINDSPWGRRRRRTTDVLSRPMLKVNFGGSDGGPSIQYFPAPESGRSEEELNECVYTKADLERFEKDRSLTVLMYQTQNDKGIAWEEKEYSVRGLEEYVDRKIRNRRQHMKEHIQSVLTEQDRLRTAGIPVENSECIRDTSMQFSKHDANRAIAIGTKDAKEVGHGISARRLLMAKFKSISNRSLWRIAVTEPVDTVKNFVTDISEEVVNTIF